MDQNAARSDNGLNTSNQQQNVHLHMHHVCNCQGNLYPTYYPTVGYRTPVPPMVTYPPHHVPRPYLQHYQYTQYNVGGQYQVPLAHGAGSVYGSSSSPPGGDLGRLERKGDRSDEAGSLIDGGNDGLNCDSGQITPPTSELLLSENNEATNPENFVKFLEKSCVMAEQIAHRNRNRPCFRNIQNLCIRTRSEILKPCTTISNIHSQGIPWATKDFIYAFVRLTNCWHILKGYWDNRDGSSLGKIEKELTPEFRACYVRWEKETMELAAQLTRVFYNLDTNLGTSQMKPTAGDKKLDSASTSTLTNMSAAAISTPATKNVRGIIHLPTNAVPETADQANQTYAGDFCVAVKEEGAYDSEEDRRGSYKQVYMKPGSYNVPKKDSNDGRSVSPRGIEFLETAQNVNKAPPMNDRYWSNIHPKKPNEPPKQEPESDLELNLASHLNVHEWILSSNFSDYGEPTPVQAPQQSQSLFVDGLFEALPLDPETGKNITLLQRGKCSVIGAHKEKEATAYQELSPMAFGGLTVSNKYESGDGGLTEIGTKVMEMLLLDLTKYDVLEGLDPADQRFYTPILDIETISSRLKNRQYVYVNEIIRDLRYMINYFTRFAENFTNSDHKKKDLVIFITEMFSLKLCNFLEENFPEYDFADVQGDMNQTVGPLKAKQNNFLGEKDRYL